MFSGTKKLVPILKDQTTKKRISPEPAPDSEDAPIAAIRPFIFDKTLLPVSSHRRNLLESRFWEVSNDKICQPPVEVRSGWGTTVELDVAGKIDNGNEALESMVRSVLRRLRNLETSDRKFNDADKENCGRTFASPFASLDAWAPKFADEIAAVFKEIQAIKEIEALKEAFEENEDLLFQKVDEFSRNARTESKKYTNHASSIFKLALEAGVAMNEEEEIATYRQKEMWDLLEKLNSGDSNQAHCCYPHRLIFVEPAKSESDEEIYEWMSFDFVTRSFWKIRFEEYSDIDSSEDGILFICDVVDVFPRVPQELRSLRMVVLLNA
eukprot:GHVP01029678.1.p1 GENE.GHVP01029678.1~~GHVP01029678.1.p1  ORF type:complete len:324 (-),score=75.40 GHVP01029678.1:849-1820(-)